MAARSPLQILFVGGKNLKLNVRNYLNFTITFSTIWISAGDFFKVLLKLKSLYTRRVILLLFSRDSDPQLGQVAKMTHICLI